jgi:amino acid permease
MVYIKKVISFVISPITKLVSYIKYRKKIRELQKRDPFIYK